MNKEICIEEKERIANAARSFGIEGFEVKECCLPESECENCEIIAKELMKFSKILEEKNLAKRTRGVIAPVNQITIEENTKIKIEDINNKHRGLLRFFKK